MGLMLITLLQAEENAKKRIVSEEEKHYLLKDKVDFELSLGLIFRVIEGDVVKCSYGARILYWKSLARLEKLGYVESRRWGHHRNQRLYRLTEKGRSTAQLIFTKFLRVADEDTSTEQTLSVGAMT